MAVLLATSLVAAQPVIATHEEDEDATLELEPTSGPAGEYVWASGVAFTEDDELRFGGAVVDHDLYDEEGETKIGFTVPDVAPGEYEVSVINDDRNASVCCFEVTEEDTATTTGSDASSSQPSGASDSCKEPGMTIECNEFGSIRMPSRVDMEGDQLTIKTEIWLNTNYKDREARHILFSIRNISDFEDSPITIELLKFGTETGDIITTRMDHEDPNELNLWVDVLDTPVQTPITLEVRVGSSERGAYDLETIVIPFDRGYAPISGSGGQDVSLFAFTLLGVKDETGGSFGGGLRGVIPGFGVAVAVAAAAVAVAALTRRYRSA